MAPPSGARVVGAAAAADALQECHQDALRASLRNSLEKEAGVRPPEMHQDLDPLCVQWAALLLVTLTMP